MRRFFDNIAMKNYCASIGARVDKGRVVIVCFFFCRTGRGGPGS